MGTGYTRNDTVNNIADGNVINASDLDGEFDAVQAAFNESTGHTHDGTSAEGAPVTTVGPAQDVNVGTGAVTPKTDNTIDLGSGSLEFKDLYIDGTANIDSLVADTADINAGTIDGTVIGGATPAAATVTTLTVNGNTTLGDAATDTVTFTADVASNLIPSADNTHDLGASGSEWKDLYIDGTANIDSLVADTADINAGTIDGVTIGGASPGVATFTTANATTVDATNIEVTNIKAKDGSASATIADATGVMTIASSVLTTADINGGTIDNATIATSNITVGAGKTLDVSAGTLTLANDQISGDKVEGGTINATTITTLTSTTGNITNVNATTVDTTNIEVTNIKAKDGTAAGSIADSTGVVTLASSVLTTTDINGGTIDNTAIGGASAAAGAFTTLNTSGAVVFNDAGANVDFRVEGDTDANLLVVDASADAVGIGTSSPSNPLSVAQASSSTVAGFSVTGPTWSMIDINTTNTNSAARNWRLAGVLNSFGRFEIISGSTQGGAPDTTVFGVARGSSIALQGATPAAGIGITFPASQSASSNANTLDDYEEGTWTPSFLAVSGSATYTNQQGTYTKIGRQVTAVFYITVNVSSTLTTQNLTGLPFTGSNTNFAGSSFSVWSGIGGYCNLLGLISGTSIQFRSTDSETLPPVLRTLTVSNGAEIAGCITYFTS